MTYARNQALGAYGERLAADHLRSLGLVILDRNWTCRHGEIDIVARDGDVVVFCEVKARRGVAAGTPLEAITPRKLAQLRRLAGAWLAREAPAAAAVRIDALGVCWPPGGGRAEVVHIRGIT